MRYEALALLLSALTSLGAGRVSLRPTDNGEARVNPGMGWTLHFYSNFIETVGRRDGTPVLALPMNGDDGHRRYKVGSIRLGARLPDPADAGK